MRGQCKCIGCDSCNGTGYEFYPLGEFREICQCCDGYGMTEVCDWCRDQEWEDQNIDATKQETGK